MTRTMRINRKFIPKDLKSLKLKKHQHKIYTNFDKFITLGVIRDKKKFILLSTSDSFFIKNDSILQAIHNYNKYSKGVDRLNQYTKYYRYNF